MTNSTWRIGIDLGGSKIAGAILDRSGAVRCRSRRPTPAPDYGAVLAAIVDMVAELEAGAGTAGASVGIGIPGSLSPASGLIHNANSTWLNGRPLDRDLARLLGRPVRISNDANCFALSEAVDGAGAGLSCVLGVILGTGCGSGIVVGGRLLEGARGTAGEWGHNPLPWPQADELPGPECWCGRRGCMETWVSGPGLAADHARATGEAATAADIAGRAAHGDAAALATLDRHLSRLARGLAALCNIIDPDVVVLGGGLSNMPHLYAQLPARMVRHLFAEPANRSVLVRPPTHGDASGVRGAAWLWE